MKSFCSISLLLAAVISIGCERSNSSTTATTSPTTVRKPVVGDNAATPQPDNTAVNQRDRSPNSLLPTDQGNTQADVDISASIRQRILRDKEVSVAGRNVKVITRDGNVTLRGPVASEAERDLIVRIARDVAGPDHVSDSLEAKRIQ